MQDVLQVRARLGEGPLWDPETESLYWVDIYNHRVHRFTPASGATRTFDAGDVVGAIALGPAQTLILALRHEIGRLDLRSGEIVRLRGLEGLNRDTRLNDGKCDAQGRLWVGSMSDRTGEAKLYRYDPDGSLHVMEEGLTISNGLGWSPDGATFYLTDSPAKTIYAYDFEPETGQISARRILADLSGEASFPDGLAVDREGCIWSAQWEGSCLIRFGPDGQERSRLPVPVPRVTSCAFGGPELRDLYITTASVGMSEKEIDRHVSSGDLFLTRAEVSGLPAHRFGGRG